MFECSLELFWLWQHLLADHLLAGGAVAAGVALAGFEVGDVALLRRRNQPAACPAGIDVVTVSRRLGHGSPAITLSVYAHLFKTDQAAAAAIEAAFDR
jgi:hypothetical protein